MWLPECASDVVYVNKNVFGRARVPHPVSEYECANMSDVTAGNETGNVKMAVIVL